jgi:hypothetical protein
LIVAALVGGSTFRDGSGIGWFLAAARFTRVGMFTVAETLASRITEQRGVHSPEFLAVAMCVVLADRVPIGALARSSRRVRARCLPLTTRR